MLKVLFAPLQGYTTGIYRRAHAETFGGVDTYYAPFLRIENGRPRDKDLRDLENEDSKCEAFKVVPQIIANSVSEFKILADALLQKGFTEIDFNMGCPFPMQVNRHRGAGLISDSQTVQEIMDEIKQLTQTRCTTSECADARQTVKFSVKMRLGQNSPDEAFALLPILNDTPLAHITLHPRLGKQQYKGAIDFNSFERFYNECRHPLIYNGDITTVSQINELERKYPKLAGVMIGRGLLARPSLAAEYKAQSSNDEANSAKERDLSSIATPQDFINKIIQMHQAIFGKTKKIFKKIKKAGKISEYNEAFELLDTTPKK